MFIYFNSIKVRLEPDAPKFSLKVYQFQFHKGTIRTKISTQLSHSLINFNSIKVRLEPNFSAMIWPPLPNFNSIKVRLEHIISQLKKPLQPFQFHKGTIRTAASGLLQYRHKHFNSIKVRLELTTSTKSFLISAISIP